VKLHLVETIINLYCLMTSELEAHVFRFSVCHTSATGRDTGIYESRRMFVSLLWGPHSM